MNNEYILPQFKIEQNGKANEANMVKGTNYRFTVLTDYLIRLEFAEDGLFEDRPSQVFINRNTPKCDFKVSENNDMVEINTSALTLVYKKSGMFTRQNLSIKLKERNFVWYYGMEESNNLGGTYRTLDDVNGKLKIEKGLVSRDGYVVIDDSNSLVFNEDSWIESRTNENIDLYFFGYLNDYQKCLTDFNKLSGTTKVLPRYALGNWWSRYWSYSDDELSEVIHNFSKLSIPLSVCIIDMDWHKEGWTGYSWNKNLFKDPQGFIDWLHSKNIKTSLNLHPADGVKSHEDMYLDVAKFMDVDYENNEGVPFDCADPKFMNSYFKHLHHPHEQMGIDFWWIDWQQGKNTSIKGLDPLWMLNHLHYMDMTKSEDTRPFIFSRWPGLGGHRYPIGFSGDTHVTWDSLAFQPYFTATAANVSYGWWSHDIGGHFSGSEDSELYTRWVQFGVFSPIMRLHTTKNYYNKREPWRHDLITQNIVADYMQLRHKFIPYLYTMSKRNEDLGEVLIRPMYYTSKEELAYQYKDQYLFGTELLVAPITEAIHPKLKVAKKKVWFPEGIWFDFFTGDTYDGNREYTLYNKIEEMPVFAKAGAIIPLANLIEENQTNNPEVIDLMVFSGANNTFELYEDDGISLKYENGAYVKTLFELNSSKQLDVLTINQPVGDLSLIPTTRSYNIHFKGYKNELNYTVKVNNEVVAVDTKYIPEQKTTVLTIQNINNTDLVVIEINGDDLIDQQFNYEERIMDILESSTIETDTKAKLGFIYPKYGKEQWGILSWKCSFERKLSEILWLNIDHEVKEMVLSIMLKNSK